MLDLSTDGSPERETHESDDDVKREKNESEGFYSNSFWDTKLNVSIDNLLLEYL